jgi:hypothetical protein
MTIACSSWRALIVGRPNLVADFDDALRRTREILDT